MPSAPVKLTVVSNRSTRAKKGREPTSGQPPVKPGARGDANSHQKSISAPNGNTVAGKPQGNKTVPAEPEFAEVSAYFKEKNGPAGVKVGPPKGRGRKVRISPFYTRHEYLTVLSHRRLSPNSLMATNLIPRKTTV